MQIRCEDIDASPANNCRATFSPIDVAELAGSIEDVGLLQPVLVSPGTDKPWRLVAGFRRFCAVSRVLKRETIEATVLSEGSDEALANLLENLQREELDPVSEAKAIDKLFPGCSCRYIGAKLGKGTTFILQRRAVLTLPEHIQAKFASREIPLSRVNSVVRSKNRERAVKLILSRKASKKKYVAVAKQKKRSKRDIYAMTVHLMENGIGGIPTRLLAWVNGNVTTEVMRAEILASLEGQS